MGRPRLEKLQIVGILPDGSEIVEPVKTGKGKPLSIDIPDLGRFNAVRVARDFPGMSRGRVSYMTTEIDDEIVRIRPKQDVIYEKSIAPDRRGRKGKIRLVTIGPGESVTLRPRPLRSKDSAPLFQGQYAALRFELV